MYGAAETLRPDPYEMDGAGSDSPAPPAGIICPVEMRPVKEKSHFRFLSRIPGPDLMRRKPSKSAIGIFLSDQVSFRYMIHAIQDDSGADGDAVHRIFCYKYRHFQLFRQKHVNAMEQGSAAGQYNAPVDNIG